MGAWIETLLVLDASRNLLVAPYVGAWIETLDDDTRMNLVKSHPTWVRGLKLITIKLHLLLVLSHPTWVRGLKPFQG